MIVELMRAWTPEEMIGGECGICGHEVAPASVVVYAASRPGGLDMGRVCASCVEYLGSRNPERCPTIEEYRELLRRYPGPMYASEAALDAATEEAGFMDPVDLVYHDSWVWQVKEGGDLVIYPTVIYRIMPDGDTLAAVVVNTEDGRALCVFRNVEEAEKYRRHTGQYSEEEGFKPIAVDHETLADMLRIHDCTLVAMPEPWSGTGGVDTFTAENFIKMLEQSPMPPV